MTKEFTGFEVTSRNLGDGSNIYPPEDRPGGYWIPISMTEGGKDYSTVALVLWEWRLDD